MPLYVPNNFCSFFFVQVLTLIFFLYLFLSTLYKQIANLITNQKTIIQKLEDQNQLLSGIAPAVAGDVPIGIAAAIATTVAEKISPLAEEIKSTVQSLSQIRTALASQVATGAPPIVGEQPNLAHSYLLFCLQYQNDCSIRC